MTTILQPAHNGRRMNFGRLLAAGALLWCLGPQLRAQEEKPRTEDEKPRAEEEKPPTAEQVMDQYLEATGGKAAYRKLKNSVVKGKFSVKGTPFGGKIEAYAAEPNKRYVASDWGDQGISRDGTDGEVVWSISPKDGPQILTGRERALALQEAYFHSDLEWQKVFKKAEVAGTADFDGHECFKLIMTPEHGDPITRYYDKKSHLLVGEERTKDTTQGKVVMRVGFEDYKKFGDLVQAGRSTLKTGDQEWEIVMESFAFNVDLPPDRFAVPAEVKALMEKDKAPKPPAEADKGEKKPEDPQPPKDGGEKPGDEDGKTKP